MIGISLLIFIISCIVLVKSGTLVVKALTRIAQFLKWREFVVSSILMAFATSLPEFFIGINSAILKSSQLSFGNILGSNIIALTLVIGIGAVLAKEIKFEGKLIRKSLSLAPFITLFPLFLILDRDLSRWDGLILLMISFLYFSHLLLSKEKFTKIFPSVNQISFKAFFKDLLFFLIGIFAMLFSARLIVFSALKIANIFNLSLVIVGALIIAIGTSLPEIAFGIRSILLKHKEMILGDVMGSVVVNSTLVLGITSLIYPFEIKTFSPYFVGIIFTFLVVFFFSIFAKTGYKITRKEAICLLAIYILFIFFEIFVK